MRHRYIIFISILILLISILFFSCPVQGGSSSSGGGSGSDSDSDSPPALTVSQVVAGGEHTVVLLSNGTVKCWGWNDYGQLGYGDTVQRGDGPGEMGDNLAAVDLGIGRTAVQIAAGGQHTVVLLDDGTVKCWGYNFFGQLGYGDTNNRGDDGGEMGGSLPAVDLGTDGLGADRTAVQIATGAGHTVALLDNGTVKCWGRNYWGQLGYGNTDNRGDGAGEMGDSLAAVDLGTGRTAVQIAAGGQHTVVLLDNNTVKCWGYNFFGQLGYGDTDNRGDGPLEMGGSLSAVDLGTDGLGADRTAVQITAGINHTLALLDNGTVKCWGYNNAGLLGYGDTVQRGDGVGEMGDNLPSVDLGVGRTAVQIAAGELHTLALLDNGTVKCWGYNASGQLGYGDTVQRGDEPGEMGDNLPSVDVF